MVENKYLYSYRQDIRHLNNAFIEYYSGEIDADNVRDINNAYIVRKMNLLGLYARRTRTADAKSDDVNKSLFDSLDDFEKIIAGSNIAARAVGFNTKITRVFQTDVEKFVENDNSLRFYSDVIESAAANDRVPFTATSAAIIKILFDKRYYDDIRRIGADIDAVEERYDANIDKFRSYLRKDNVRESNIIEAFEQVWVSDIAFIYEKRDFNDSVIKSPESIQSIIRNYKSKLISVLDNFKTESEIMTYFASSDYLSLQDNIIIKACFDCLSDYYAFNYEYIRAHADVCRQWGIKRNLADFNSIKIPDSFESLTESDSFVSDNVLIADCYDNQIMDIHAEAADVTALFTDVTGELFGLVRRNIDELSQIIDNIAILKEHGHINSDAEVTHTLLEAINNSVSDNIISQESDNSESHNAFDDYEPDESEPELESEESETQSEEADKKPTDSYESGAFASAYAAQQEVADIMHSRSPYIQGDDPYKATIVTSLDETKRSLMLAAISDPGRYSTASYNMESAYNNAVNIIDNAPVVERASEPVSMDDDSVYEAMQDDFDSSANSSNSSFDGDFDDVSFLHDLLSSDD